MGFLLWLLSELFPKKILVLLTSQMLTVIFVLLNFVIIISYTYFSNYKIFYCLMTLILLLFMV